MTSDRDSVVSDGGDDGEEEEGEEEEGEEGDEGVENGAEEQLPGTGTAAAAMHMGLSPRDPPASGVTRRSGKPGRAGVYRCVNPVNQAEAKVAFLADPSVDPVFRYAHPKRCQRLAEKYSCCSRQYFGTAAAILEAVMAKYGSESRYLEHCAGPVVDSEEAVAGMVGAWLREHQLAHCIKLSFSRSMVAPASMSNDTVSIATEPLRVRQATLPSTLNHEVGTHFMRKANEKLQPWCTKRKRFKMCSDILCTEEGLACLNTHLGPNKWLWQAALHYYAAVQGAQMSFRELFADLKKYIDDEERRWNECLRVKRGLTDTSIPGSFCKDQCYLEGSLAILRQRHQIDFKLLHCGRIALSDLPRIRRTAKLEKNLEPCFLADMGTYRRLLDQIVEVNNIGEIDLPERESLLLE